MQQENLANATVSARQLCVCEGPYSEEIYGKSTQGHNVEKYTRWVTTLLLAIGLRVYLYSFSRCWLPNQWNPTKLKVIQGHRSWCQLNIQLPI